MATTTIYTSKDAGLLSAHPTTNYGSNAAIAVGNVGSVDTDRSLLGFTVSTLANLTINSVYLKVYIESITSSPSPSSCIFSLNALTRHDWVEAQATWNIYKTASNWTTAGGDYTDTPDPVTFYGPSATGWMTIDITDLCKGAVTDGTTLDLLWKCDSEIVNAYFNFYAKESSGYDPYILVDYTCPTIVVSPSSTGTYELPAGDTSTPYSQTFTQTGAGSTPYWEKSSGTLPTGLTLNSGTGVLSGTPSAVGTYNFTIKCSIYNGGTCNDTQAYSMEVATIASKTLTDSVSSVTETISNTTASYSIVHAFNNEAFVMNTITGTFSFIDNLPFSSVIYRPDISQLLGTRRDVGNLSVLNSGGTFDGTAIDWHVKSGFYDLGSIDEIKKMEAHMAEAIKRLRVMYLEAKSADGFTLTIRTENDSTGKTFAVEPQVQDNETVNLVRIALSRDIRGKYIQFELAGSCDAWIGQMKVGIKPRGLK